MPNHKYQHTCLCGCGKSCENKFAQGHDMTYLGQCLNRLSTGDSSGADDLEHEIPGHAKHYDMACLRRKLGRTRKELAKCRG
jgi:hypothetical protein